jgi:hypothetical protein
MKVNEPDVRGPKAPGVLFWLTQSSPLAGMGRSASHLPTGTAFDACSMLRCSHGLGLFVPEVHELSGNGFRNGLEQALHVLQL